MTSCSATLVVVFLQLQVVHILILLPSPLHSQPVYACDVAANRTLASLGFCNRDLSVGARVADLVSRLTLEEKVGFLISGAVGVSRLGIPKYEWWSEALHGVSYVGPGTKFGGPVPGATSFPQVITTAASFNTTLFEAIGKVVSTEARAMHNVGLAGLTYWSPNVNIFRDPRWGRGQETPGEDPLLSSKYASSYVRGLQQTVEDGGDPNKLKVAACCKHYTAYDLDSWKGTDRFHFNAVVTQQDLEDTYQPPFKSCVVQGNVASVMCSYNQVNGKPTCADPDLLSATVRGKWKLNGYIVSDCDSVQVLFNSQHYTKTPEEAAAKAILAGLDLNCGSFLAQHTPAALKAGLLKESDVNNAISNNFATLVRLGFFDGNPTDQHQLYGGLGPKDVCTPAHQDLAREAARQGIVLLKNDNKNTLPWTTTTTTTANYNYVNNNNNNNNMTTIVRTLAVIGPNANVTKTMIGNYEGTPCKYVTPLQGLSLYTSTSYLTGCPNVACTSTTTTSDQISDAAKLASAADATVLVMGIDQSIEAEGRDRIDLLLPGLQQQLVSAVASAASSNGHPVVLVIMSGGGFDISFAKNNDNITAILWVGYPGEAGGAALADIIFGAYNPSGRLPMTWYPQSYVDKVPMTNMNMRPNPSTGYPGRTYRFYTGQTVYTFGDGLSYTQFKHTLVKAPTTLTLTLTRSETQTQTLTTHNSSSSLLLPEDHIVSTEFCRSASSDSDLDIHIEVTNTGSMPGTHTVFLFYKPNYNNTNNLKGVPTKHLLAFDKITQLRPHQQALLKFKLDPCNHLGLVDQAGNSKISLGLHQLQIGDINHLVRIAL